MAPIHKTPETNIARLQIVKQGKVTQLVAFLKNFSLSPCMNFILKSTDIYESLDRSGKFCIRIVDAKFALHQREGAYDRNFVCLDIPKYPGEHDDIMIGFDTELGKAMIEARTLSKTDCYFRAESVWR